MQGPRFALIIQPTKIIDAVGRIAALLNLRDEQPGTYGMHPSSRDVEHISHSDIAAMNDLHKAAFIRSFLQISSIITLYESVVKAGPWIGFQNNPHFGFAQGSWSHHSARLFIVGMNLQGQILGRR